MSALDEAERFHLPKSAGCLGQLEDAQVCALDTWGYDVLDNPSRAAK